MPIKTAKEVFYEQVGHKKEILDDSNHDIPKVVKQAMIEFAKLHVEAALKAAEEHVRGNITDNCSDHTPYRGPCVSCGRSDNFDIIPDPSGVADSIVEAYPLTNIK